MEPEDLAVIGHTGDLLVDIYARNLTHIYILPQCSTTAARVLNPAGMDAQFERLRCAISRGILTFVMLLQIVMRYVFQHSLSWPEEFSRYCFVYITFLTFGYCIQHDSMLRLDIIKEVLPKKAWDVLQVIVILISAAFFLIMLLYSFDLLQSMRETGRVSAALGIPYFYIYLSTTVGFALALFRTAQRIWRALAGHFKKGEVLSL